MKIIVDAMGGDNAPHATVRGALDAVKLGVMGAVVFTVVTWLYSYVQDRLSSGAAAKAAPVISALGIYLAAQSLMGMF